MKRTDPSLCIVHWVHPNCGEPITSWGRIFVFCRILNPASFCQRKFIDTHRETSDLERASELLMGMIMAVKSLAQRAIVRVESLILPIRGDKIIIDSDLARIYGVTTRRLNEQVKRNLDRFPRDFMFRLTSREFDGLMSQFATSNT